MKVSVVILTLNSEAYIRGCLLSLMAQGVKDLEVIVVDNGSTDQTIPVILAEYPQVLLVRNNFNRGASFARNQGVACASGTWVLALDSDVVLEPDFFEQFLLAQEDFTDNIGLVQTNILDKDGVFVYSQGIYLSLWRRFFDINRGRSTRAPHPGVKKILGPCSAAAFYRRSMLERIREATGCFDERFFFLVEDVDLAWRARRAGWRVSFCERARCKHIGNGSATNSLMRQYLSFRNRHLMINKNENLWRRAVTYALALPYDVPRFVYMLFFNRYMWQEK